jgi:uncharacterized protein involved in exopolysaccharide biosynthesis
MEDLKYYLKIFKSKWKIFLCFFLFLQIITGIKLLLSPKIYQATAVLLPPEILLEKESLFSSSIIKRVLESPSFKGLRGISLSTSVIISMFSSRRISEMVAKEMKLVDYYKSKSLKEASKCVRNRLHVKTSKDFNIIVSVSDTNPVMAAKITNCYIRNLDKLNDELKLTLTKPLVCVLDSAVPVWSPISPKKRLKLAISMFIGLFGGIGLVFILNYLQQMWRKSED